MNWPGLLLFILEAYHVVGHSFVLFRIKLLPRKDLVRVHYYFAADLATVFVTCFLYTKQLRWLATIQMIQHAYFVFSWNKHFYCNKVINWSSLDWQRSEHNKHYEWDVILGTLFDTVVHLLNAIVLSQYVTYTEVGLALLAVTALTYLIYFNKRMAWSNPSNIPEWVAKRMRPLPDKYTQYLS